MDESVKWRKFVADIRPEERRTVQDLVRCLRTPLEESILPGSDIVTAGFAAEFRSRLLTQHVFVGTPLVDLTFERAFIESMVASGGRLGPPPGSTGRFWDCEMDGRKFSLKSTRAKSLSRDKANISKLTEAAWIQDCRTATSRREHTRKLFSSYLESVNRLIQIRYFEAENSYELLEIPLSLFKAVDKVPVRFFQAEGSTIGIPVGQIPPDFTLVLDRSDAKITLRNILVSRCVVHARWRMG